MIKDNIKNANKYSELSPSFQKAFDFLEKTDLKNLQAGKYQIEGDNIYVNIDEYQTRTSDAIEAHKVYIDIQYIISGEEYIGVTKLDGLKIIENYNSQKDISFYNGEVEKILLKENEFIILYPEDAHLPCQQIDIPRYVKKAVVKIKNNLQ